MVSREETQKMVEVMQAYARGADVQFRNRGLDYWSPLKPNPDWDWLNCEYRIKTEPREWWMVDTECGHVVFDSPKYARDYATDPRRWRHSRVIIHVREVLDE